MPQSTGGHATSQPSGVGESVAGERAFNGRMGFGTAPAVLVVDAARAYTAEGSPLALPTGREAVAEMASVIAAARQASVPVLYTQVHYPRGAHQDAPLFARKVPALEVFDAGSALGAIHDSLSPRPEDDIITKKFASAFFGTHLHERLRARGIDTVVVIGFSTTGCVRATAVDALQYGFRPIVVADAVADRTEDRHRASLADLDSKYADVLTVAEVTESIAATLVVSRVVTE